jgi:hypothetical protein
MHTDVRWTLGCTRPAKERTGEYSAFFALILFSVCDGQRRRQNRRNLESSPAGDLRTPNSVTLSCTAPITARSTLYRGICPDPCTMQQESKDGAFRRLKPRLTREYR